MIAKFEGVDNDAGSDAATWLRHEALDNHGSTVTWLLIENRQIQGFYAMASASVRLSQRHRKKIQIRSPHDLKPTQPASLIAWIGKARDSGPSVGRRLFQHAVSTASEIAEVQGNIAIVVDAYDAETAAMWQTRYGFTRASSNEDGTSRLWAPLLEAE